MKYSYSFFVSISILFSGVAYAAEQVEICSIQQAQAVKKMAEEDLKKASNDIIIPQHSSWEIFIALSKMSIATNPLFMCIYALINPEYKNHPSTIEKVKKHLKAHGIELPEQK